MKKFISALLAISMLLLVASCGQISAETETTQSTVSTTEVAATTTTEETTVAVPSTQETTVATTVVETTMGETTVETQLPETTEAIGNDPVPIEPFEKSDALLDDVQEIKIGHLVTLRYNGNTANVKYTLEKGVGMHEIVNLEAEMCNGFTFDGWSEKDAMVNGVNATSLDLSHQFNIGEKTTIYLNTSAEISYYADGDKESGCDHVQKASAVFYLHPSTLPDEGYFSKEGYILTGYNTKADGTGISVSVGARAPYYQTGKFDLYCIWEKETDNSQFSFAKGAGAATVMFYTGNERNVVIPSFYEGVPVTSIATGAFQNNATVERVVMGKNINQIQDRAFSNCENLETLVIYESIFSMNDSAFENCPALNRLYINALNTQPMAGFGFTGNKLDRLSVMGDKKKIIIVGGSGSLYGFHSDLIKEAFDGEYDVINLGENMDIPSVFYFDMILPFAKEGDIILWAPEPLSINITGTTNLTQFFWQYRNDNYGFTKFIDFKNYTHVFSSLSAYFQSEWKFEMLPSDQLRPFMNIYGDNLRDRSHHADKYFYNFERIRDCAYQTEVMTKLQEKGVRIFFTYASMQKSGAQNIREKSVMHYEEKIQSYPGVVVISDWKNCIYEDELFWNSSYHMTNKGAEARTKRVITDMQTALKGI